MSLSIKGPGPRLSRLTHRPLFQLELKAHALWLLETKMGE